MSLFQYCTALLPLYRLSKGEKCMRRRTVASLFSLMLIMMVPIGCISEGGDSSNTTEEDMPVVEDFQGLDYVECMTHEDLERC